MRNFIYHLFIYLFTKIYLKFPNFRYLATEILGERKFTKAADIFALGVTILELATDLDLPKVPLIYYVSTCEGGGGL